MEFLLPGESPCSSSSSSSTPQPSTTANVSTTGWGSTVSSTSGVSSGGMGGVSGPADVYSCCTQCGDRVGRARDLADFRRRLEALSPALSARTATLAVNKRDFCNRLNSCVQCVGCRKRYATASLTLTLLS